jgi:hypothetical protein
MMELMQLSEAYNTLEALTSDLNPAIKEAAERALRIYHLRAPEVQVVIEATKTGNVPDRLAAIEELGSMMTSTGS